MTIFSYLLLFFSVLLSGLGFFIFKKSDQRYLKLSLAFSGAYLFAISVIHLIPETYSSGNKIIGVYILAGFLFQILLEFFSEGIEHGHIHVHKHNTATFPLAIIVSLCVHSFFEGMPLVENISMKINNSLLTGIILHHVPVAFALMSMLIASGTKKNIAIILLILFAAMAPLGAISSSMLSNNIIGNISSYFDIIMAFVIGIFLHISTTILFESSEEHHFNIYKMITILIGAGVALLSI